MSDNPTGAYYDQMASNYSAITKLARYGGPKWLVEHLPPPARDRRYRLLDLACANGIHAPLLRQRYKGAELIGVDVAPLMLAAAEESGLYDALYAHDLNAPLSFLATDSIDLILALSFAEFLDDLPAFLIECGRLLPVGGHLLATFRHFNPDEPNGERLVETGPLIHRAYSIPEVEAFLTGAGFVVNDLHPAPGYAASPEGPFVPYLYVTAVKE